MDGYVKNKKEALRSARRGILWSYAVTVPILLFILAWLVGIYSLGSPGDWKSTEVVYAYISSERIGLSGGNSHVLNTKGGQKFVIPAKRVSVEWLEETLVPGESYTLVYSETIAGGNHIEALCNDQITFLECSASRAAWEKERQGCFLGLYITMGLEIIGLILIDRFWCREFHARIRKIRRDIKKRTAKIRQGGTKV